MMLFNFLEIIKYDGLKSKNKNSLFIDLLEIRFLMYADIPSHTLPGGGTVPPPLLVTAQTPDLVIIDIRSL